MWPPLLLLLPRHKRIISDLFCFSGAVYKVSYLLNAFFVYFYFFFILLCFLTFVFDNLYSL